MSDSSGDKCLTLAGVSSDSQGGKCLTLVGVNVIVFTPFYLYHNFALFLRNIIAISKLAYNNSNITIYLIWHIRPKIVHGASKYI